MMAMRGEKQRMSDQVPTKTNEFCLEDLPMNEIFNGRPTLFDMLNIVDGPTNEMGRQITCRPPEWLQ